MDLQTPTQLRDHFDTLVRRGVFRPVARHLRPELVEDRLQEGISQAYEIATRRLGRGQRLDTALLVHITRCRATDLTRHLCRADGARRRSDVYNFIHYHQGRLELLRLGGALEEEQEEALHLEIGAAEVLSNNPTRRLLSAHDLKTWLETLEEEDQEALALRLAGHGLVDIGRRLDRSTSWVFARLRDLGLALRARMGAQEG